MEATSLSSSIPSLPLIGRSSTKPSPHKKNEIMTRRKLIVNAKQGEEEGKSVDENLSILRMRIKKMKSIEAIKDEDPQTKLPSSNLNKRETKLLSLYHVEDVFEVIELLHSYFTKTRPGVALGVLVLLAMSLPLSQSDIFAEVLKVARVLLGGGHVCIDIDLAMSLPLSQSEIMPIVLKIAKVLLGGGHVCIDIDSYNL